MAQGLVENLKLDLSKLPSLPEQAQQGMEKVDKVADAVVQNGGEWAMDVVVVLAMLVVGWWVASRAASLIQRVLVKARMEETFAAFLGSLGRYIIFFATVLAALSTLGVSGTNMLAVFGAAGLAVAFALRGTLTHVAAGVMIITARPFRIGDYIQIGKEGLEGTVKRITLFNTEINTILNLRIFVPNTSIWEGLLVNHSFNAKRQVELKLPIALDHDAVQTLHLLNKIVPRQPFVLAEPAPLVGIDEVKDHGVIFLIRVWIYQSDFLTVRYQMLGNLMSALQEKGVGVAYPRLYNFNGAPYEQAPPKKVKKRD